jgi:hypothetical protein
MNFTGTHTGAHRRAELVLSSGLQGVEFGSLAHTKHVHAQN